MQHFQIAPLQNETGVVRFGETKSGKFKTGSLARALVFMNKQERMSAGQALYAKWMQNGQFVPLARDMLSCGLVSKDAEQALSIQCGVNRNSVNKDAFFELCSTIDHLVRNKRNAKGEPMAEPKASSDKGFVLHLIREVLKGAQQDEEERTIDA